MDRRIRKTRKAIIDAFMTLYAKKDLDFITIREIAELADVNRVTVYQHFSDKYDILEQLTKESIEHMLSNCLKPTVNETYAEVYTYLKENRTFFQTLLKNNSSSVFHQSITAAFRDSLKSNAPREENTLYNEIKRECLATAVAGIFEWWITAPDNIPVSEMVRCSEKLREKLADL